MSFTEIPTFQNNIFSV